MVNVKCPLPLLGICITLKECSVGPRFVSIKALRRLRILETTGIGFKMLLQSFLHLFCVAFLWRCIAFVDGEALRQSTRRPNVIVLLADDQDLQLNSLDYLPLIRKHLFDQGTFFSKHYCTVALCCPSRVSLWSGKAAHNTVSRMMPSARAYLSAART